MKKFIAAGISIGAIVVAGCGSTTTQTVSRPPELGPASHVVERDAAGPTALKTFKSRTRVTQTPNYYSASGCGVERWAVKTLTDPGANQVNLEPQQTTITHMVSLAPPVSPTDRVGPIETTTYRISGTLTVAKTEADGDFHLVIQEGSNTMIVEASDPKCANGSVVLKQITEVRAALQAKIGTPGSYPKPNLTPNIPVTVTGVGFFDKLHGQTGVASNGIELHPLTAISFG
jgi:hypothetical protein